MYEINTLNNVTQATVQQNAKQLLKIDQIFFKQDGKLVAYTFIHWYYIF